jgi:radical SAM superfamily enzyme YgiQ (UPF0313 family)
LEVESIAVFKQWVLELCNELHNYRTNGNYDIEFGCNLRVSANCIDDNLFKSFHRANIKYINMGLESGSERMRTDVLKRHYTNQQFIDTVALARKYGMKVYTYNLVGIPGETEKEYFETVKLNRDCQPDGLSTSIFYPYPGTELHKLCVEQGLIKEADRHGSEREHSILSLPNFSKNKIENAFKWMNYRVYKGHKSKPAMYIHALTIIIKSYSVTYYIYRKLLRMKVVGSIQNIFRSYWKRTS